MHEMPIAREAVLRAVLAHRRDADSIAKRDAADREEIEEARHGADINHARSIRLAARLGSFDFRMPARDPMMAPRNDLFQRRRLDVALALSRREGSAGERRSRAAVESRSAARRRARGARARLPPPTESRRRARACTGDSAARRRRRVGPISTMRPRYITATRWLVYWTTRRSCEMKSRLSAELVLELLEQVDDLRLHRDVERAHRLVADDEIGLHRERPRDADALPLPAGELVRIAPHHVGARGPPSRAARRPLVGARRASWRAGGWRCPRPRSRAPSSAG